MNQLDIKKININLLKGKQSVKKMKISRISKLRMFSGHFSIKPDGNKIVLAKIVRRLPPNTNKQEVPGGDKTDSFTVFG